MVSAIVTAAGKNSRMRADLKARGIKIIHKLLLNIQGMPIILKTLQSTLNTGIDDCVVVLGHYSDEITSVIDELDDERVSVIVNPQIHVQLSESLLNGVKKVKSQYCLCVAADQPTVSTETLKKLIQNLFNSPDPYNTVSILARDKIGYLDSAEGLGMPFVCHKDLLKRYLEKFDGNLNPVLKRMVSDGVNFYGVGAGDNLELVNINTYDDYLNVVNKI